MSSKKKKGYKGRQVTPEEPKVEEALVRTVSYADGDIRRHHRFFIESGDLFLQVEKALFRIHSHFLIMYSQVWKENLNGHRDGDAIGCSEQHPVVLDADKAAGWELLINLFYRDNPMIAVAHSSQESVEVLEVVHKYKMYPFEKTIMERLGKPGNTAEYVDLIVASRITGSTSLYETALKGLIASNPKPTIEEARRLGLDVCYEIWNPGGTPKERTRVHSTTISAGYPRACGKEPNMDPAGAPTCLMSTAMREMNTDYTTGEVRRHHQFYIPGGDFVFQVEKAVFRVHSHFIVTQSDIFNDMFLAPRDEKSSDSTDTSPLILSDDLVEGWEQLLKGVYRRNPIASVVYNGKERIALLRIAHKYCMDSVEEEIISQLKEATSTPEFMDLMTASRILDSLPLYEQALQGLISSYPKPTLEEARLLGVDTYHTIMLKSRLDIRMLNRCRSCQTVGVSCGLCGAPVPS